MKKRLVSIILTVFLVLSMMPFAAFADNAIVCPACGGSVTKQERRLLAAHSDFYKCSKCGKWAYLNAPGGLKLFSVGDQQILDAADANAILNFSFNNGHLIPAEKAPSGIGRKDLPGYADDNGTPSINTSGVLQMVVEPYCITNLANYSSGGSSGSSFESNLGEIVYGKSVLFGSTGSGDELKSTVLTYQGLGKYNCPFSVYKAVAPVAGNYYLAAGTYLHTSVKIIETAWKTYEQTAELSSTRNYQIGANTNQTFYFYFKFINQFSGGPYRYQMYPITVYCDPLDASSITTINNITINNNNYSQTWNGNIYVDNSNNLTYIYPQYTTINEKNETVTNISTNPIIYNNETKQYYTYDQTTKNYYYITYNAPSPSPTPAPTWTPGGGATRGGGVGRHPSDTDAADWTLHYYVLNNRRYDAYYALKKTEVDTDTKLPWVDNKKYISTTQIPIANGQYTVSVPDGVYWRVWSWDEASQTLTGVNSSNWHSTINNFLFNATGEYIFEFCKADGSDFDTAKDVTLKLKNDKITKYEDGGTIVEEPTPSPSPEPTETPSPTEPPTHTATPNPGGGTVPTPGGDSGGGNSGSSDSGWNPFKWLTDLLKDIVETILKGLWKLLTSIFGFILWLLSLLFKLFPWMPNSGILALCAGVVVVTVIRIIKFITGR
ncbi:MAG: hypothetical protein OGM67_00600 [Oscillospiraceae bacterium]|nr:MAG: hypothetical protein OGM67_00600 [Oscillospiraceae bacterium]